MTKIKLSYAEENYLKSIYSLSQDGSKNVSTNAIANKLKTKPASVTDMIQKLHQKGVIDYEKYQGANITPTGKTRALQIIRKHRLWEVFLVQKLNFNWDEIHEVAEELEHIKSHLLIQRLDEFLGFPENDPHGDPIPDENGEFKAKPKTSLSKMEEGDFGIVVAVKDSDPKFLQYLDKIGLSLGEKVTIIDKIDFDGSLELSLNNKTIFISKQAAENILITN